MTPEPLVLAVGGEGGILRSITPGLAGHGFGVVTAGVGDEALRLIDEQRPEAVLVDAVMPGTTGLELLRRIRERVDTPVIMVAAVDSEADNLRGLELGADGYIVEPVSLEELGARIRAVLRRSGGSRVAERIIRVQNVQIYLDRRLVTRDGRAVSLTRTEWLLLQHLAANAGKALFNAEVLTAVWGPECRGDVQYLRVWVSRLRRKLEPNPAEPAIIKTMQGIGYMLDADQVAATAPGGQ
ncbi:MAG: response regulator transcription factor [Dehalococcoidia bacterium]|nr:response regulator transcription factor [Dehalococcoidia bacterium]